ncbi:family 16 glycosylhydrolase [Asanoa sp. WMMD1127]|uniref:glycoside hydrolase family 16 protein n=1 Tax=Asanoa sp. WMMD1127 TaxID=3016107 RepID=UPI002416552F|nr:glycoside hydrolase family 16 protein [Asanoa sp. WMMD1127]MDG4825014.1 family 16 glycosylhydrolase [Asanoa sp. WMMD1127]
MTDEAFAAQDPAQRPVETPGLTRRCGIPSDESPQSERVTMRSASRWLMAGVGAALLAGLLPGVTAHAATGTVTVSAAADTTFTMVPQDGDNSVKTTLATCPRVCEGNNNGQRDALVRFSIAGVPAGARVTRASLEVYSWTARTASVTAHSASGGADDPGLWSRRPTLGPALAQRTSVTSGFNSFDVTAAVAGNGPVTFALQQTSPADRTYWAAADNTAAANRPRIVIAYDTAPPSWSLAWSDEFDGSTLDTSKWRARHNAWTDYDRSCATSRSQNVFVSGGTLTIRAQRENYTCGSQPRAFTTSYLDTIGKKSFTYGKFEMRAKSPNGPNNSRGLWPAFWMRPDDGLNGEIDVTELPGGSQYYRASTSAIFRDYTPTKQDFRWTFPGTGYPGDGFHTYTTEWDATSIRWYVDGQLIWTRSPATTPWFNEVFHKPYHLRLNFQVGGWLGDPDSNTVFPADFVVDYVRVYQRSTTR